jgi:hypothetical protein
MKLFLVDSWVAAGQEDQADLRRLMIRRLELSAPSPILQKEEMDWRMS